jgi:NADH-quinone oxidoreductase subunit K
MLSFSLFIIGFLGSVFSKRHFILILICLELMILAININFISFSIFFNDLLGQINAIIFLTVAASESALGLAIVIIFYRLRGGLSIDLINLLKT